MRNSCWSAVLLLSSVAVAVLPATGAPAAALTHAGETAGLAAARGPAALAALFGWRLVPTPGSSSVLNGVFCTSASNCWAVGADVTGSGTGVILKNQALHWNGRTWSQVSIPSPSRNINQLSGVSCTSASNCWAVGSYEARNAGGRNQAFHWNGSTWSHVSTPNPGGTASNDFSELRSVTCTSGSNCWAAGDYGGDLTDGQVFLNQALHWNGQTWSQATTPNPAGDIVADANVLDSVRCTSASNCWAVGAYGTLNPVVMFNQALHWNGRQWAQISTPNPGGTSTNDFSALQGLSCTSAASCWAVGSYGNEGTPGTSLTQALHWDGKTWSRVATPSPDGTSTGAANELRGVSCSKVSDCWAVGDYGSINGSTGVILNLALHWQGTRWSVVPTPDPAGTTNGDANHVIGVACTSSTNCWAVGHRQRSGGSDVNQALHWNGSKWSSK